jgi:N-acetylglutamate synthase-like GNAT family acetyltransferase
MALQVHPQHDLSPTDLDAVEDRIYRHNRDAVGRDDAMGLGFTIRDDAGNLIAVAAGYSWAGTSELRQMWVDERHRGCGYGRDLVNAFIAEAAKRGVRRIWVASYDFQAPAFYEKLGFTRAAEFADWPDGYTNVILCRTVNDSMT